MEGSCLRFPALLSLTALMAAHGCARADWIDPGIAYRCDTTAGVFGLAATMSTSSPATPGEVVAPDGYATLSKARDESTLSCRVGRGKASASIRIIPAHEHGMCSEFDAIDIARLEVDGRLLLQYEPFSGGCHLDPVIHRIEIRLKGTALLLKTCRAAWTWETGYSPETCDEQVIAGADGKRLRGGPD